MAQITSFQLRASMSSSVTITNFVYMNCAQIAPDADHHALARGPAYCLRIVTTASRYEQPSGGR